MKEDLAPFEKDDLPTIESNDGAIAVPRVPNDNPFFEEFADEVWGRRPSSKIGLFGRDKFTVFFKIGKRTIHVEGDLKLGDGSRVEKVENIAVGQVVSMEDGARLLVPYEGNLKVLFGRLRDLFLDRTPSPPKALVGVTYLETKPIGE